MNGKSTQSKDLAKLSLEAYLRDAGVILSDLQMTKQLEFCALVLRWNRLTSLVQTNSIIEMVESHVIDCLAALAEIVGPDIVDVGSGAGFPGIVFAIAKPEWQFSLIEANARRARFLTQAKIDLELTNITIVNSRVEDWHSTTPVNCITSRAYSALASFFDDCQHLVPAKNTAQPGMRFVALKGQVKSSELEAVAAPLSAMTVKPLYVPGRDHRNVVVIDAEQCL